MRKTLRFVLSAQDQQKIDKNTIVIENGNSQLPDVLRLKFNLQNTNQEDPHLSLKPLTSGYMYFFPELSAGGGSKPNLPQNFDDSWDTLEWIETEYTNWNTIGIIIIDVLSSRIQEYIQTLGYNDLLNKEHNFFNRQWYYPLVLPIEFLKSTILNLNPTDLLSRGGVKIPSNHPQWHAFAVERFLLGGYGLKFDIDQSDERLDDVVVNSFPELIIDSTQGYTELTIALAIAKESVHDNNVPLLKQVADSIDDLNPLRSLIPSNPRVLSLSHYHPTNGLISADRTLQNLRDHLIDADVGSPLADAYFSEPRLYHMLQFDMPGNTDEIYYLGLLPTQKVKISTGQGDLLQERLLPIHGLVAVNVESTTMSLQVELIAGDFKITGVDQKLIAESSVIDISMSVDKQTTQINLQPRWEAFTDTEKQENIERIVKLCYSLSRRRENQRSVRRLLHQWENKVRATSEPDEVVFRGSRVPKSFVSKNDLESLFKGLKRLTFTTAIPPQIHPAEAMILWIMEGKAAAVEHELFTKEFPVHVSFKDIEGYSFTSNQIKTGSEEEIKDLLRVLLCWNYWGLDIMNYHQGAGDNEPALSGNLAAAMAKHNEHLTQRGLEAIKTEGIVPPTREQINQTIKVRKRGNRWVFKLESNHKEIMIWLQYAEYLRRGSRLEKAVLTTGVNQRFAQSPAFRYMAYNGGIEQDLVHHGWDDAIKTWRMFTTPQPPDRDPAHAHPSGKTTWDKRLFWSWWDRVKVELETNPNNWADKNIDEVLLKWRMGNYANELNLTSTDDTIRTLAVRINGLHFAALVRTYGSVFSTVI